MYARKSNTNRKAQKPENRANLKHDNQLGKFSAINDMQVMAPGCNVDHGLLRAISVKAEPAFSLKKVITQNEELRVLSAGGTTSPGGTYMPAKY